jgi:hypothetical protein
MSSEKNLTGLITSIYSPYTLTYSPVPVNIALASNLVASKVCINGNGYPTKAEIFKGYPIPIPT